MFYAAAVVHGKDDKYLIISLCWGGEEAGGGPQGCRRGREHPYLWGGSQG